MPYPRKQFTKNEKFQLLQISLDGSRIRVFSFCTCTKVLLHLIHYKIYFITYSSYHMYLYFFLTAVYLFVIWQHTLVVKTWLCISCT